MPPGQFNFVFVSIGRGVALDSVDFQKGINLSFLLDASHRSQMGKTSACLRDWHITFLPFLALEIAFDFGPWHPERRFV
jgi:hypothetical protein